MSFPQASGSAIIFAVVEAAGPAVAVGRVAAGLGFAAAVAAFAGCLAGSHCSVDRVAEP